MSLSAIRVPCALQFSQAFEGSGADFFAAVEKMELEGIVSKRRASIDRSGPSTGEFAVIGYERKRGAAPSLLLAEETDAVMRYVGRAIPAIPQNQRDELWQALEFLHADRLATPIGGGNKGVVPVQPLLKVMAKHLKGEENLRHATVIEALKPR